MMLFSEVVSKEEVLLAIIILYLYPEWQFWRRRKKFSRIQRFLFSYWASPGSITGVYFSLSSLILFLPLFLPLLFPILLLILELGWPHPAFREADWQGKEGPHGGPCGVSPWAVEADRGVGVTHGGLGGSVPSESCPHFWLIPSYDLNGFVLSQSNRVWLSASLWTVAARLLCPWDSLGKSTGVGCHALLQGIFPTHRSNPSLLYCRWILYCWATGGANGSKGLHFQGFSDQLWDIILSLSVYGGPV